MKRPWEAPNLRAILARMPEAQDHIVPIADIDAARERLTGTVHRTALMSSATAARWTTVATGARLRDDRLYLKPEHLQKTGSFKARGMTNRIATLPDEAKQRGAITLSAGNAGQAYAWAGRAAGVPMTVVMPEGAVRSKVEACLGYGARVVLHGAHVGETFAEMERIRDAEGLEFVHPFDDPAVIAGHGSIGLELLEDLPDLDVVVVGVGGGGLISGVAAALKERRPGVRVYGVEPERSNAMTLALERNEVVRIQPDSVADGLGAPFAGVWTLAMCRRYLDDIVLLDDPTILAGMRFALERLKQVLEPAGAAALAAVLAGRIPIRDDERVAVVMSGGNVEVGRLGPCSGRPDPCPEPRRDGPAGADRPARSGADGRARPGTELRDPCPGRSDSAARDHAPSARCELRPVDPDIRRHAPGIVLHRRRGPWYSGTVRPRQLGRRDRVDPQDSPADERAARVGVGDPARVPRSAGGRGDHRRGGRESGDGCGDPRQLTWSAAR